MDRLYKITENTALFLTNGLPWEDYISPAILWKKAYNTIICDKNNLPIPKSIICTTTITENYSLFSDLMDACTVFLGSMPYIIRSSYPTEDWTEQSNAWKFLSVVCWGNMKDSIDEIKSHALSIWENQDFYIIIQPYIVGKTSWILFTLDPLWDVRGQRMVFGDGDNRSHVSGEKNMTTKFFSRNKCEDTVAKLGMQCEALFGYPQDIERVRDENNTVWLLQSRHITTLRDCDTIKKEFDLYEINSVHQQNLIKNNFWLTWETISIETISFIKDLFQHALNHHYAWLHVKYTYTDYIKTILWTIYIDKEKQKASLFTSWDHFSNLCNYINIRRHRVKIYSNPTRIINQYINVYNELIEEITTPKLMHEQIYEKILHSWYPIIFTVSFCYEHPAQKFFHDVTALEQYIRFQDSVKDKIEQLDLIGNSVNLDDKAKFMHAFLSPHATLRAHLKNDSRILVTCMTTLLKRNQIGGTPQYLNNLWPQHFIIPVEKYKEDKHICVCSPWKTTSMLMMSETVSDYVDKPIIYVKELVPTLVEHFSKISGIIAMNWSELSHLAIVAREQKIPVISWVPLASIKSYIGKVIILDTNSKKGFMRKCGQKQ